MQHHHVQLKILCNLAAVMLLLLFVVHCAASCCSVRAKRILGLKNINGGYQHVQQPQRLLHVAGYAIEPGP